MNLQVCIVQYMYHALSMCTHTHHVLYNVPLGMYGMCGTCCTAAPGDTVSGEKLQWLQFDQLQIGTMSIPRMHKGVCNTPSFLFMINA